MSRPRKNSLSIESSYESVIDHIKTLIAELNDVRTKALRDYNEIRDLMTDGADRITMEHIRLNAFKSYETFFKMRIEVLKIHVDMCNRINTPKLKDIEKEEVLSDDIKNQMQKQIDELRRSKNFN